MGSLVVLGANLQCSFGAAPSVLCVLPDKMCMATTPVANIMDYKPMVNIVSFGTCSSMANPTVAAATAAKLGVMTPMPCIPNTVAPWIPGCPTVLVKNMPALNDSSKLMCVWGGVIQVLSAGQATVQVP